MKKRIIILSIFSVFIMVFLVRNIYAAEKQVDFFKEILVKTNSEIKEYGVTAVFITKENRESVCNNLLKKLGIYDSYNTKVLKNENTYCVEFEKNNVSGYIETMQYENHNIVTINFTKKDKNNDLNHLKDNLKKSIEDKRINVKYFQYLKAKLPNDDINSVNNEVSSFLKNYGATNIDRIQLDNGYSTTAYTKTYDSIQNNGKLIDFNYAVCKYSSGGYIIIGTPEINVTY